MKQPAHPEVYIIYKVISYDLKTVVFAWNSDLYATSISYDILLNISTKKYGNKTNKSI